jgi:lysophospholipase L1-like esterase
MARVFVWGGSTVYGLHDPEGLGFAGRLKSTMMKRMQTGERPAPEVVVSGMHGRTLNQILGGISLDVASFLRGRTVGVFLVGASDSRIPRGGSEPKAPLAYFKEDLGKLALICEEHAIRPVYLGFPPIDNERTNPFGPTGEYFSDDRIQAYVGAVEAHANSTGATFVPTWSALSGGKEEFRRYLSFDGLHQNELGHAAVHDLLLPAVDDALALSRC